MVRKTRDQGAATWCVRKHTLGAMKHIEETIQKLQRLKRKGGFIYVDLPTHVEINAAIQDVLQCEWHIDNEILPKISGKTMKRKFAKLSDKYRSIRQKIAGTGILYFNVKKVPENTEDILVDALGDLQKLLVELDYLSAGLMRQEQVECEICVEDLGLKEIGTEITSVSKSIINKIIETAKEPIDKTNEIKDKILSSIMIKRR